MSRARSIAFAVASLALQGLLAFHALEAAPRLLRLGLAFVVLVLGPGLAWLELLRVRPPGGAWLSPGWALGLGVAWNGLLILLTRALGMPFTALSTWTLVASAGLWALAAARAPAAAGPENHASPVATLPRAAWITIVAAAVFAVWHCARFGSPLDYYTDSPDHVATIRRMLETGDAFPTRVFFADAGFPDPRKGLWHPQVALLCRLAGVDPVFAWRLLPALVTPLFVLNAASLGALLGGGTAAAVSAWAMVLTYGASLGSQYLRETHFSTKLSNHLVMTSAVAMLADLVAPRRALRFVAAGLALGACIAHVFGALALALVVAGLGVGLLIRDRGLGPQGKRLKGTALTAAAICLPYTAWRVWTSWAPGNSIHSEPQSQLFLWDQVPIVSPGLLWDWTGSLWVLFPLAAPALWRQGRTRPAALYLLTTAIGVAMLSFNPLLVALLIPRVGYLMMRWVWVLPLAGLVGWAAAQSAGGLATSRGPDRARYGLGFAILALLLLPALQDAVIVVLEPGRWTGPAAAISPLRWGRALRWMDQQLPKGSVILSDPVTSYSIPMMTRQYVVTLEDQHGPPGDPRGLDRLLDARDALDPYATWDRTREVVARYGVTAVALNNRFSEVPRLDYWAPRPEWFATARARLDRHPSAFEPVYDSEDFVIYRVRRAGLDSLVTPPPPRPCLVPFEEGRLPVARRMGEGLPALHGLSLDPGVAAPGDSVRGVITWRVLEPLPAGAYSVAVRFDRALPGGFTPPRFVSKPVRKLIERVRGERYRFRFDHLPVSGSYGVDLWRPTEAVLDSFAIEVPADVADGEYLVRVRMLRKPHYPNYRLSDYFFDDDYYTGLPAATLKIERRHGTAATAARD